jgi:hypothetical protein
MTTPPPGPDAHTTWSTQPQPAPGTAYGYPAPYQQPPRPRRTGPKILTFTGLAVLVAGGIAGVVGIAGAAGGIADLVPTNLVTTEGTAGSDALALGPSTTPLTFDVQDEGAFLVYEVSDGASARLPISAVTAEGPNGPLSITPPDQVGSLPVNGWSVFPVGVLVPDETGSHTVVVDPQLAADDVSVAVSGPLNADSVAGIGDSGLVFLLGFLVGGLGFLLLIAGIIWWAVARK